MGHIGKGATLWERKQISGLHGVKEGTDFKGAKRKLWDSCRY